MRVFTSIRGPVHANGPALKSRFSPAISLPSFFFFFCPPCFVPVFRVPSGGTSWGLWDKKREEPGRAVLIAVNSGDPSGRCSATFGKVIVVTKRSGKAEAGTSLQAQAVWQSYFKSRLEQTFIGASKLSCFSGFPRPRSRIQRGIPAPPAWLGAHPGPETGFTAGRQQLCGERRRYAEAVPRRNTAVA